jgi:hypothetical protein
MTNLLGQLTELVLLAHEANPAPDLGMVPEAAWDSWFLLANLGMTYEGWLAWHHACWYGPIPESTYNPNPDPDLAVSL